MLSYSSTAKSPWLPDVAQLKDHFQIPVVPPPG